MKYLTLSEVKELLTKENEERELNAMQRYALAHAEEFGKLKAEESRKLVEELMEIDIVDEKHAVKIADILPVTPDEVRVVFYKEKIVPTLDDIKKILEIVAKYR